MNFTGSTVCRIRYLPISNRQSTLLLQYKYYERSYGRHAQATSDECRRPMEWFSYLACLRYGIMLAHTHVILLLTTYNNPTHAREKKKKRAKINLLLCVCVGERTRAGHSIFCLYFVFFCFLPLLLFEKVSLSSWQPSEVRNQGKPAEETRR